MTRAACEGSKGSCAALLVALVRAYPVQECASVACIATTRNCRHESAARVRASVRRPQKSEPVGATSTRACKRAAAAQGRRLTWLRWRHGRCGACGAVPGVLLWPRGARGPCLVRGLGSGGLTWCLLGEEGGRAWWQQCARAAGHPLRCVRCVPQLVLVLGAVHRPLLQLLVRVHVRLLLVRRACLQQRGNRLSGCAAGGAGKLGGKKLGACMQQTEARQRGAGTGMGVSLPVAAAAAFRLRGVPRFRHLQFESDVSWGVWWGYCWGYAAGTLLLLLAAASQHANTLLLADHLHTCICVACPGDMVACASSDAECLERQGAGGSSILFC
jgi:hypothetical protein